MRAALVALVAMGLAGCSNSPERPSPYPTCSQADLLKFDKRLAAIVSTKVFDYDAEKLAADTAQKDATTCRLATTGLRQVSWMRRESHAWATLAQIETVQDDGYAAGDDQRNADQLVQLANALADRARNGTR
jgi:hypothetical protein